MRCGARGERHSRCVSVTSPLPPGRTASAGPPNPAIATTERQQEKKQVKTTSEVLRRKLAERQEEAHKKGLKDAEELFTKLEQGTKQLVKNDEDRKQALVKLNDLAKDLEKRRDDLGGNDRLKEQLEQLKNLAQGPADKMADAMRQGDFQKAAQELKKLRDQIENGQLDPLMGRLVRDEMATNWWRYVLVNVPLVWCGMWPGGIVTLLLLPLFVLSLLQAVRRREPALIFYAAPAVLMLGLHAAVGNHYTRYNFILIGPYSIGAAWIICSALPYARWRERFLASGS